MKTIQLSDDSLDSRGIEKRMDYLRIGNDFLPDSVTASEIRKFITGDHLFKDDEEADVHFNAEIHDQDELEELANWIDMREQVENYNSEWRHGVQIIGSDNFTQAMKQRAEDTSDVGNNDMSQYIDWEKYAEDQKSDFVEIDVNDHIFFVRCN